jgi:uncharacterized surface protein with fasciclin (FAS1) repeats
MMATAMKNKMTLIVLQLLLLGQTNAFQAKKLLSRRATVKTIKAVADVQNFINENYPSFDRLILSKNQNVWKKLSDAESFTIFCPTDSVFTNLPEKRLQQLKDVRNLETVEKMAEFHCVNEPVTAEELFNSGGVITLGGVVDVKPSVSGGFFGIGGTEDGGVTVNSGKVTKTVPIGSCILHEVDALVSPELLWRFCDQLRIPGSK